MNVIIGISMYRVWSTQVLIVRFEHMLGSQNLIIPLLYVEELMRACMHRYITSNAASIPY